MNEDTSVYLDAVRFAAAMAVFFDHISNRQLTGGLFWQMEPYGREAVDVFFVLSGFVIAYVHDTREKTPLRYAVSRFARIYSVAIPALIVTFMLDVFGRAARPGIYDLSWGYHWHGRISQFLDSLVFINQTWFNDVWPGSDVPYWSLGYEVWYYVIFAVAVFAPRRWRVAAVLMLLAFVGPKIVEMFPVWLLGVAAYYICKRDAIPVVPGAALCVGALTVWIGYEVFAWRMWWLGAPVWLGNGLTIQDYIIGFLFFVHLIGFRFSSHIISPVLQAFKRPIRWIAGATLTLYLFHMPLSQFLAAEAPWPAASWQTRLLICGGVPVLVFVISECTERRKEIWRRGFQNLFSRMQVSAS